MYPLSLMSALFGTLPATTEDIPLVGLRPRFPRFVSGFDRRATTRDGQAVGDITFDRSQLTFTFDPTSDLVLQSLPEGESQIVRFNYRVTLPGRFGGFSFTLPRLLRVVGVNDAPVANDDFAELHVQTGSGSLEVLGNVLDNDTDIDLGAVLEVSRVEGSQAQVGTVVEGEYGSVHIFRDGSYKYFLNTSDPDTQAVPEGANVQELFEYTVADEFGASSSAKLTIAISGLGAPGSGDPIASFIDFESLANESQRIDVDSPFAYEGYLFTSRAFTADSGTSTVDNGFFGGPQNPFVPFDVGHDAMDDVTGELYSLVPRIALFDDFVNVVISRQDPDELFTVSSLLISSFFDDQVDLLENVEITGFLDGNEVFRDTLELGNSEVFDYTAGSGFVIDSLQIEGLDTGTFVLDNLDTTVFV